MTNATDTVQVNLRMRAEERDRLKDAARRRRESLNEFVLRTALTVVAADWEDWMKRCGLAGENGQVPLVEAIERNASGHDEIRLLLPEGVTAEQMQAAIPMLEGLSNIKRLRIRWREEPGSLTLVAGPQDLLTLDYPFSQFEEQLLFPPTLGELHLEWFIGVGPDGLLLEHEWSDSEMPLTVMGRSGAGKSFIVQSLLRQICHNNDPADLEVWMLDALWGLHAVENLPHVARVERGVEEQIPTQAAVAEFLEGAVGEMIHRFEQMAQAASKPQRYEQAKAEGVLTGEPYVLVVCEDFRRYLEPDHLHPDGDDPCEDCVAQGRTHKALGRLSREGLAAGFRLVMTMQPPWRPLRDIPEGLLGCVVTVGAIAGSDGMKAVPGRGVALSGQIPDRVFADFRSFDVEPTRENKGGINAPQKDRYPCR